MGHVDGTETQFNLDNLLTLCHIMRINLVIMSVVSTTMVNDVSRWYPDCYIHPDEVGPCDESNPPPVPFCCASDECGSLFEAKILVTHVVDGKEVNSTVYAALHSGAQWPKEVQHGREISLAHIYPSLQEFYL